MMKSKTTITVLAVLWASLSALAQSSATYEIVFNIPQERTQKVTGYEVLHFNLNQKQDVTLEFKGDAVGDVAILNGKKVPLTTRDGRIVLPKKQTVLGQNRVQIDFSVGDDRLSRHDDYLCTLAVPDGSDAMFPCLGGSDVPIQMDIKLNLPNGWKGATSSSQTAMKPSRASFTTGRFNEASRNLNGHDYRLYFRPEATLTQQQQDDLFAATQHAMEWMERYTGMGCPLNQVCLVMIPGYRTSDVKHPGAILVGEKAMLLKADATDEEKEKRMALIAHETAHLWLGSLVTTADAQATLAHETLVNYLTAQMVDAQQPEAGSDRQQQRLRRAIHADQTGATRPISQELSTLEQTGLSSGDLMSDRATIMMQKLVELMGEETFRSQLQQYLRDHAYGSATVQDINQYLHAADPTIGLATHFTSWATHSGLPTIETSYRQGRLVVRRTALKGDGCGWNQKLDMRLIYEMSPSQTLTIDMLQDTVVVPLPQRPDFIIPNFTGNGYARFKLTKEQAEQLAERPIVTRNAQNRYALLQTLYDNYLTGTASPYYFGELVHALEAEKDPANTQLLCHHLGRITRDSPTRDRVRMEMSLLGVLQSNQTRECHQEVVRTLSGNATCGEAINGLYAIWQRQSDSKLTSQDYTQLAYRLAILRPNQAANILQTQRARLSDDLARQEFDYVSRACTADTAQQRQLFQELLLPEKRGVEPWAEQALSLLSTSMHEPQNNYMITPGLEALEQLRLTSSPSFPGRWLKALLAEHTSRDASMRVRQFLAQHPDLPIALHNAILEEAYELLVE